MLFLDNLVIPGRNIVIASGGGGPPVTSGLIARWESDNFVGLSDGAAVDTWADQSGNTRDATQSTTGLKPLYKTNIFGTKPSVRFDGSDDVLNFSIASITDWTYFIVLIVRAWTNLAGPFCWRGAAKAGFMHMDMGQNSSLWGGGCAITNTSDAFIKNAWRNEINYTFPDTATGIFPTAAGISCHRFTSSGTLIEQRKNSQAFHTCVSDLGFNPNTTGGLIGRGGHTAAGAYLNCDIGAILVYDHVLTNTEVGNVFTYLNNKYSVY